MRIIKAMILSVINAIIGFVVIGVALFISASIISIMVGLLFNTSIGRFVVFIMLIIVMITTFIELSDIGKELKEDFTNKFRKKGNK